MTNENNITLTAIYDKDYKRIVIRFMEDGSIEFAILGDVTDAEILAAAEAEGGELPGWSSEISF